MLCKKANLLKNTMIIKTISIKNFGSIKNNNLSLEGKLNIISTSHVSEVFLALELLLLRKPLSAIENIAIMPQTSICAQVVLDEKNCVVTLAPNDFGEMKLCATDENGNDVSNFYRCSLIQSLEQDALEVFDGFDPSFPLRLFWYRYFDECNTFEDLIAKTNYYIKTQTFRSHLLNFFKLFQAEPILEKDDVCISLNEQGIFEPICLETQEKVNCNQIQKKLFLYNCFLNIAKFWEEFIKICDMHHQSKPIVIKNFLEQLDESVDASRVLEKTKQLNRQVIILKANGGRKDV